MKSKKFKYLSLILSFMLILNMMVMPAYGLDEELFKSKKAIILRDHKSGYEYSHTRFSDWTMEGFGVFNPKMSDIEIEFSMQFTQNYDIKLYALREGFGSLPEKSAVQEIPNNRNDLMQNYMANVTQGPNGIPDEYDPRGTLIGYLILSDDDGKFVADDHSFEGYQGDIVPHVLRLGYDADKETHTYIWDGGVKSESGQQGYPKIFADGEEDDGSARDFIIAIEPKGTDEPNTDWAMPFISMAGIKLAYQGIPLGEGQNEYDQYVDDPINMRNGNFYWTYTPLKIEGNHELSFDMYYNSIADYRTNLGHGFRHSFEYNVVDEIYATRIKLPSGKELSFKKNLDNTYERPAGSGAMLIGRPGNLTMYLSDGRTYIFDSRNRLSAIKEGEKTIYTLSYAGKNLQKVESDCGYLLFSYDDYEMPQYDMQAIAYSLTPAAIRANSITAAAVRLEGEAASKAITSAALKASLPDQPEPPMINRLKEIEDNTGRTISFSYDGMRLKGITNADGDALSFGYGSKDMYDITTVTDYRDTVYIENTYDNKGRVVSQYIADRGTSHITYGIDDMEYGDETYVNIHTDPAGNKTKYYYSQDGLPVKIESDGDGITREYEGGKLTKETDRNKNTTTYEYDAYDNMTAITYPDGTEKVMEYANPQDHLLKRTVYPDGTYAEYTYDENRNVTQATDQKGNTTAYTYDANGNLLRETDREGATAVYTYNSKGWLTEKTDKAGGIWTYEYDEAGRITKETTPEGQSTTFTYTAAGKLMSSTDADGNVTSYDMNPNGYSEKTTDPMGFYETDEYDAMNQPTAKTDKEGNTTRYKYDPNGNIQTVTDPLGNQTTYTYDKLGRLSSITDKNGNTTEYGYDANGNVTEIKDPLHNQKATSYDVMNRPVTVTDERGAKTAYTYDSMGRVITVTDALGSTVTYTYDANGNKLSEVDKNGNKTSYEYDNEDRVTKIIDALNNETVIEYDAEGRVIRTIDREGAEISSAYDREGKITAGTDEEGNVTGYEYDTLGRIAKITNADSTFVTYEYDANSRVTKITNEKGNSYHYEYDRNGRTTKTTDPLGGYVQRTYTANGQIETITDEEGGVTRYSYDANGNVKSITDPLQGIVSYTYDSLNRVTEVTDPNGNATSFEYDETGNVTKVINADEGMTTNAYDLLGRITASTDEEGHTEKYEYDANGNIEKITDRRGNATSYVYDALNRVTSITNREGNETLFTYDKEGRRTSATDEEANQTVYTYDKKGRVTEITNANGLSQKFEYDAMDRVIVHTDEKGVVRTFEYDARGNITKYTDGLKNSVTYEYDANDRLIRESDKKGNQTTYTYDKKGRTTAITDREGYTVKFDYDLNDRITSVTDENNNTTKYEYDLNGNIVKVISPNTVVTPDKPDKPDKPKVEDYTYHYGPGGGTKIRPVAIEEPASEIEGSETNYYYDEMDRLVKVEQRRIDDVNKVDEIQTVLYEYDKRGLVIREINQKGDNKLHVYDANGNLIQTTDEDGYVTKYGYTPMDLVKDINYEDGRTVNYMYNKAGYLIKMDDWNGTTVIERDELYRIVKAADHNNRTIGYTWDEVSNRTSMTYPDGTKAEYTYDAENNMKTVAIGEKNVRYSYDPNGNITEKAYSNQEKVEYDYDRNDRQTGMYECRKTGCAKETTYTYDPAGNRTGETMTHHQRCELKDCYWKDWDKDDFEKKEEELERYADRIEDKYDDWDDIHEDCDICDNDKGWEQIEDEWEDRVEDFEDHWEHKGDKWEDIFDDFGFDLDDGEDWFYERDYDGFDIDDIELFDDNEWCWFDDCGDWDDDDDDDDDWDDDDRDDDRDDDDDRQRAITLNSRDRDDDDDDDDRDHDHDWDDDDDDDDDDWDDDHDWDDDDDDDDKHTNSFKRTYKYDANNQLISSTYQDRWTTSYTYDSAGNLTKEKGIDGTTIYKYNVMNQLTEKTNAVGMKSVYEYDNRGNHTKEVRVGVDFKMYTYDSTNRMTKAVNSEGHTTEYTYNGLGIRVNNTQTYCPVVKIDKDYIVDFTSTVNVDIMEISNGATTKLFYGNGRVMTSTDITVPKYEENFTFYVNQDIMNNDTYLSHDKTYGSINLFYDVWGRVWDDDDDDDSMNGKNFTGYTYDRVIGKHFAQYRFYDAVNKRFMAVDPVKDGNNWYAYVNNNPASFVDPLGLAQDPGGGYVSVNKVPSVSESIDFEFFRELGGNVAAEAQKAAKQKESIERVNALNKLNTNAKEMQMSEPYSNNSNLLGYPSDEYIQYDIQKEQVKAEIVNISNDVAVKSEETYTTIYDAKEKSKDSPQEGCRDVTAIEYFIGGTIIAIGEDIPFWDTKMEGYESNIPYMLGKGVGHGLSFVGGIGMFLFGASGTGISSAGTAGSGGALAPVLVPAAAGSAAIAAAGGGIVIGSVTNLWDDVFDFFSESGGDLEAGNMLPNAENAIINPKKLTEYALNPDHPAGKNKAKVFDSALGYNRTNFRDLMNQIYEKLPKSKAILGEADIYGQRYTVDISITGPNGKTATVRTGWIIKPGSATPELTTLFVK